jgi:hypothetical protein
MAAVFASNQSYAGSFRADFLTLSIAGVDARGMIVQAVSFNYNQQVSLLYELGSPNVYYIGGRAQGSATISHIAGPGRLGPLILRTFRDMCAPSDLGFVASAGCNRNFQARYMLQSAVLVGFAGAITSQDAMISNNLQLTFLNLDVPS